MRVLVTGLGGELGTRVALLLEASAEVEAIPADILPAAVRLWESQHRCSIWSCPLVQGARRP